MNDQATVACVPVIYYCFWESLCVDGSNDKIKYWKRSRENMWQTMGVIL